MFGFSFHKKRTPKKRTTIAPPDFGVSAIQRAQVLQQQLNNYQNQVANYHYHKQIQQQGQQQSQHGSLLQQYATAGPAYGTTFKQSSVSMAYGVSEKEPVEFKKKEDTKKLLTDILTDKLRNAKR